MNSELSSGHLPDCRNVPSDKLDHIFHGRENIRLIDVVSFVEKRFDTLKQGTDFADIEKEYHVSKHKAQRILKRGREKRLLFTLIRKSPQQFFPESRRFEVIDHINKRNNVLKDTTGTSTFKSPLSFSAEQQKASNFLDVLLFAKNISRQIHKIVLEFIIDRRQLLDRDYYNTISPKMWEQNKAKVIDDFIDERKITFIYYRNNKVVISVACSNRPFSIETEDGLSILHSFIGQIRDRLEYQLGDPKGRLIPQIGNWILKQCDINKDVPISDSAQVSLPDIQLKTAFRVFRTYVKNLQGQPFYRIEESVQINQPLRLLELVLHPENEVIIRLDTIEKTLKKLANQTK